MTPSWYDVLGVDDDATDDQIREAWQDSITGLTPGDRRFKQRNRAAEVLLDPARRAAHDADLAADEEAEQEPGADVDPLDEVPDEPDPTEEVVVVRRPGPGALVASGALVLVAVLLVVATVAALVLDAPARRLPTDREIGAARTAAEAAIVPILSYDYRDLDATTADAEDYLTPAYAETYRSNIAALLEGNAERTKTIVTSEVVSSGTVRTGEGRVDVLVFVNQPIENAQGSKVNAAQVTVRMVDTDGRWLVDCLIVDAGRESC